MRCFRVDSAPMNSAVHTTLAPKLPIIFEAVSEYYGYSIAILFLYGPFDDFPITTIC